MITAQQHRKYGPRQQGCSYLRRGRRRGGRSTILPDQGCPKQQNRHQERQDSQRERRHLRGCSSPNGGKPYQGIIFDDSTTSWFKNLDTPATIQRPRRPGMLHLALDFAATLSGSGPVLLTRSRINHSKLEDVDTPRRLTMILYS